MKKIILPLLFTGALVANAQDNITDDDLPPWLLEEECDTAPVPQAQDKLAFDVFRDVVAEQQGNVVFSPASMEGVLRILQQGAAGATKEAFDKLQMGQTGIKSAMQVESADAIFAAEDMKLKPVGVKDVQKVSFLQPAQAAQTINSWCNNKTHGLIPQIVSPDSFDANTRLVATNAVYLKERWLKPFDTNNTEKNGKFKLADGSTVKTPLMRQTSNFHYAEGADWKAVALFYDTEGRDGETGCFLGILPKGDAREFAATLTAEKFNGIRKALAQAGSSRTAVSLPQMEVRTQPFSLKNALAKNGLAIAFSTANADFSNFADEPLYLSEVVQSCYVKVDEKETVAAAVTAGIVNMRCARPVEMNIINFDRPFIWAITDITTDAAPYFLGLYEKP